VNAYKGNAGMLYLQVFLCDPCHERFEIYIVYKMSLYKYSSFPFSYSDCPEGLGLVGVGVSRFRVRVRTGPSETDLRNSGPSGERTGVVYCML